MTEIPGWKKETDSKGVTTYHKTVDLMMTLTITNIGSKFVGAAFGVDKRGIVEVSQGNDGNWHKSVLDLALTPDGDLALEEGDLKSQVKSEEKIPKMGTVEQLATYLESLVPKTE